MLMPAWPLGVDLHQGPARHRPAHSRHRSGEAGRARSRGLDRADRGRELRGHRGRSAVDDDRCAQTGHTLFGDNCAACHGVDAKGGKGFPNLTTASWLWGGDRRERSPRRSASASTRRIRNSRTSQMPAFGRDQMLKRDEIENVVAYVRSLSDPTWPGKCPPQRSTPARRSFQPTASPVTAMTPRASRTSARPT